MNSDKKIKIAWKDVENLKQVHQLVDYGVLLKWGNMRTLKRKLTTDQQLGVVRLFAERFCEHHDTRLPEELIVESLLVWLANVPDESHVQKFLEVLLTRANRKDACL